MTRVRAVPSVPAAVDAVAVPLWSGPRPVDVELDLAYLKSRGFEGRLGEIQALRDDATTVVAVGMGPEGELTPDGMRRAAAAATRASGQAKRMAYRLLDASDSPAAAQALAEGVLLASYGYAAMKSAPPKPPLAEALIVVRGTARRAGVERGITIATSVALARDLINEPAGTLTPTRLASVASRQPGLSVTALTPRQLEAAGMGGLLGVARGSEQPARLIELLYEPAGATADTPTLAFVGKGITFDSGGLSIKTSQGMMTMKTDMSGAAAVIAAMRAIAAIGAPVRVLGLCPATENMPSGSAIRPGDVLRTRSGTTVEVLNTDAEGRLVLADGLALAVEAGVDAIVDIATLTGAVSTALGRGIAGLMGNDDAWVATVQDAAARAGESVWHLPLPPEYRRELDSEGADLKNIGSSGTAGTLIAGLFLNEFTAGVPWTHLDIAGTARSDSDDGYVTKGGTGWGVRSLVELATSGPVPLREGATRRARWKGKTPAAVLARPARA